MQLLIFNEEFLVSACHQRALITSLPFVHTARRSYRLNDPVRPPDCGNAAGSPAAMPREAVQTLSFRGRRSRNKVSVGEPAEGSFARIHVSHCESCCVSLWGGDARLSLRNSGVVLACALPPCGPLVCTYSFVCSVHQRYCACILFTTFSDGCLGSNNDEGRSEVR